VGSRNITYGDVDAEYVSTIVVGVGWGQLTARDDFGEVF
jgi:hypothetical protein